MHAKDRGRPKSEIGRTVWSIILGLLGLLCFYGAIVTLVGAFRSGEIVVALFIAAIAVLVGLVFLGSALRVMPGFTGLPRLGRTPHPHKHGRPKHKH